MRECGWWSSGWRLKICGVPSCTASIVRAFSSLSLSLRLSMPPFLSFTLSLSLLLVVRRSSLFSRTLYISLYRSLRDEAFVLVARCDARRCAVRALRVKP